MAILLTLASGEELELLGITTVAGNVPLTLTQANARKVCTLAGRADAKVYAGYARPILRPLVTAEYVHGEGGLDTPISRAVVRLLDFFNRYDRERYGSPGRRCTPPA